MNGKKLGSENVGKKYGWGYLIGSDKRKQTFFKGIIAKNLSHSDI